MKEQKQLRKELAKQRKEELVGRAEGREDAVQDQGGGYESSSQLYSDTMNENDADSRVRHVRQVLISLLKQIAK